MIRPGFLKKVAVSMLLTGTCLATEGTSYSPYAGRKLPMQVLWGDTHLHTSYSVDAFAMGAHLTPEDAYRFARGETVTADNGMPARLGRPLDFLVIADHAEYLGLLHALYAGTPAALAHPSGQRWHDKLRAGGKDAGAVIGEVVGALVADQRIADTEPVQMSVWKQINGFAETYNQPGFFSAFTGFEWSSSAPDGDNLHRVVMFRDGADKTTQVRPFSALDSRNPEDLWQYLADYEKTTGGTVLAIPHNGNLSNGRMFPRTTFSGDPIDRDYAKRRARWEPVVEVVQSKGDGETHPLLSLNDEFADFGTWDLGNITGSRPKETWMLQYEYARSALRLGLELVAKSGANPYRFGMIGSTDSHTALATLEEQNYWGNSSMLNPSSQRAGGMSFEDDQGLFARDDVKVTSQMAGWQQLAAGYAAVWATANTREAIFDAMKRREVYATTGPRMTVRFFGGWDFEANDVARPDYALIGYDKGVPMGGELPPSLKRTTAPRFMITALKDPQGANLDRVQVIKGWLDADGKTHEQVYDVAWSGDRQPAVDGRLPAVGSTVDLKNATWRNTIGAVQLSTVWTDPDFDPDQRAFYYVRVLEIPTPRWVVYDQVRLGAELPVDAERVHQERAYTSPIWYEPPA